MRAGESISVSPADRRRLQALIKDRNAALVEDFGFPLSSASGCGQIEIVQELLAHQASVNAMSFESQSAIKLALENDHLDVYASADREGHRRQGCGDCPLPLWSARFPEGSHRERSQG